MPCGQFNNENLWLFWTSKWMESLAFIAHKKIHSTINNELTRKENQRKENLHNELEAIIKLNLTYD